MPNSDRKRVLFSRAKRRLRQVSVKGFQLMTRVGSAAGEWGTARLTDIACDRDREHRDRGVERPLLSDGDERAAEHGADQDGDEGAHLDHPVAADQLRDVEMLRQVAVLHGPEQRGVHAHHEQRREQRPELMRHQAEGADHHDGDLQRLHETDEPGLLQLVGELSRGRREEDEGKDENARDEVHDQLGVQRRELRGVEGHEQRERDLEHVVVHRAEELRPEEGTEAALSQQLELVVCPTHRFPVVARHRSPWSRAGAA
jgi:hypothetical protein